MKYADGVMTSAAVRNIPGLPKKPYTDVMLEKAMGDAIERALGEGIDLNSPEMRKRILDARAEVKNAGKQ
jgi:hypothetical protein